MFKTSIGLTFCTCNTIPNSQLKQINPFQDISTKEQIGYDLFCEKNHEVWQYY